MSYDYDLKIRHVALREDKLFVDIRGPDDFKLPGSRTLVFPMDQFANFVFLSEACSKDGYFLYDSAVARGMRLHPHVGVNPLRVTVDNHRWPGITVEDDELPKGWPAILVLSGDPGWFPRCHAKWTDRHHPVDEK